MFMTDGKEIITRMTEDIIALCDPCMIYLVSEKHNSKGALTGFKVCVVVPDSVGASSLETRLLLKTDCPVPCDFIVYNITDWDEHAEDDCSFAYRVENGGELLYVKRT